MIKIQNVLKIWILGLFRISCLEFRISYYKEYIDYITHKTPFMNVS